MQAQGLTDRSKLSRSELAVLIGAAIVTMTFVSMCSPLYPFNPWDDANCFLTLGRGIIHGLVPYRDLYEQKGPLLYFIYAFAALISESSFIGALLFEYAAASVYAIFSWKIAKLFTKPSKYAVLLVPILLAINYTTKMFNYGGNAEELCFPLLTVALYFALRSIVTGDGLPSNREAVICGLIAGALFWIKYTFLGFIIGLCIYILVISIKHKQMARLWSLIWRFIAGFIALSVPILIYFVANGSLDSLWEAYFYNNIFLYQTDYLTNRLNSIPVIGNIAIVCTSIFTTAKDFIHFGILLVFTLISCCFIPKEYRKKAYFLLCITAAAASLTAFTRPIFVYYYGYILAYGFGLSLIGAVKLLGVIEKVFKNNERFIKLLLSVVLVIIFIFSIFTSKNLYLLLKPKDELVQYRMAEIINQTPDAKILTYDVMDSGFYTAAGLMPSNRFFCYLNIERNYPAILEEQNRLIEEGYFDYIVTSYFFEEELDNYELILIDTHTFIDYTGLKEQEGFKLYKKVQTT